MGLAGFLNSLVHLPVLDQLLWHAYWILVLAFAPVMQLALGASAVWSFFTSSFARVDPAGKVVVVTGCDTGFGYDAALRLDARGFTVVAGCLGEAGAERLRREASSRLHAVLWDVTSDEAVAAAAEQVAELCGENGLHALVNNAGVGLGGLVDWTDMAVFRKVMEVNFFAFVAVTKALLPQLKAARGRVVNVTSVAGLMPGAPGMAAYAASKHAAEAFTDSLRAEMRTWGVTVITCNPSFHKTPLVMNIAAAGRATWESMSAERKAEYGQAYCDEFLRRVEGSVDSILWDPVHVANALEHAVAAAKPKVRYLVGLDARFLFMAVLKLPSKAQDFFLHLATGGNPLVPAALAGKGAKQA